MKIINTALALAFVSMLSALYIRPTSAAVTVNIQVTHNLQPFVGGGLAGPVTATYNATATVQAETIIVYLKGYAPSGYKLFDISSANVTVVPGTPVANQTLNNNNVYIYQTGTHSFVGSIESGGQAIATNTAQETIP